MNNPYPGEHPFITRLKMERDARDNPKNKKTKMDKILACLLALPIIAAYFIYSAWVFSLIWEWFIAPVTGFNTLSVPEAFGIIIVVNCFRMRSELAKSVEEDWREKLILAFALPTIWLATGYIVTLFI